MGQDLATLKIRSRKLYVLQVTVAVLAVVYVLWLVDWGHAKEVFADAEVHWLGVAFGFLLLGFVPAALRWAGLLRALGTAFSRVQAYRTYLTGAFYGLAMPGVIGGDAARVWFCLRDTKAPLAIIAGTVLAERALGVVALIIILSMGAYLFPTESLGAVFAWAPVVALALVVVIVTLPGMFRRLSLLNGLATSRLNGIWGLRFRTVLKQVSPIKQLKAGHLLTALALSLVFQAFDILATFAIAQAVSIEVSIQMLLIAMPIVYLATVLPISPGGLGVREATLVIVLTQFGLSASEAALLAVAVFLNRVAVGLVGAAQHFASGKGSPAKPAG